METKVSKDTEDLNHSINHFDQIDIYRILHSTSTTNIFFSSAHRTVTKIKHMLGHKINLNTFQKTELF